MLFSIAWKSLLNRKISVALTLASLTLSVIVVVGVEHIRSQARASFDRTVSGVDLIVGARTSQINLLLYSVFRIGNATNGISSESYELIAGDPRVAWTIPLSLGDSHRGYRVLGTDSNFFEHFRFAQNNNLEFSQGKPFSGEFETVLGSELARQLGYKLGDSITLSHGLGAISFSNHESTPFTVSGILEATGTPVDQTLHVTLEGLDAAHGLDSHEDSHLHDEDASEANHISSDEVTAFMLGLHSRMSVFEIQGAINEYTEEPLLAILPGVALAQLWEVMGSVESILALISALVMMASLLGIATMLFASMRERQREIFLLRSVGMHSSSIFFLIEIEAIFITTIGIALGLGVVWITLSAGQNWLSQEYGLIIDSLPLSPSIAAYLGVILLASLILSLLPGLAAYRSSLGSKLKF